MIANFSTALTRHEIFTRTDELARLDDTIIARYKAMQPWGIAASIDLGGCDPDAIRDPHSIQRFVISLCHEIDMRRFGDPIIVRFGDDPVVCGYSLAQLIETSLISGHFAEESDSAYIDIFSCKPYRPYATTRFCLNWFGAATARLHTTLRQAAASHRADRQATAAMAVPII